MLALNEHGWNCVLKKTQFSIGAKYVADYIVLSACSGYWNCLLIEMQSHRDPIFTKKGEESAGLREARKQINDWKIWINENEPAFREQLADFAKDEVLGVIVQPTQKHQQSCEILKPVFFINTRC